MQNKLTSECDSLRKALELAQKEVASARRMQKEADGRVATIEAQLRAQETKLESMRRHLEKPGSGGCSEATGKEGRIKSLEALCTQKQEENRQLRTQLAERAAKRAAAARVRWRG
jgi:flagellar biosynthesis chaperone FliJ